MHDKRNILVLNVCVLRIRNKDNFFQNPSDGIIGPLPHHNHPQRILHLHHGIIAQPPPSPFEGICWVTSCGSKRVEHMEHAFLGGPCFFSCFFSVNVNDLKWPLSFRCHGVKAGAGRGHAAVSGWVWYRSCLSNIAFGNLACLEIHHACVSYWHKGIWKASYVCLCEKGIPQNQNDFLKIFIAKVFKVWAGVQHLHPPLGNMHSINARSFRC